MGRIFEKRKKSIFKTAAQNSKLYSRYSKQLYMAAKNGVPDPEANATLRSVKQCYRFGASLDEVCNAYLACDLPTELCQWPQAGRPQRLVTLRRFKGLGESSNGLVDFLASLRPVLGKQHCVDAFDSFDQAFSLLDEAVRTLGALVSWLPEG